MKEKEEKVIFQKMLSIIGFDKNGIHLFAIKKLLDNLIRAYFNVNRLDSSLTLDIN